jgi:hypothetical protein
MQSFWGHRYINGRPVLGSCAHYSGNSHAEAARELFGANLVETPKHLHWLAAKVWDRFGKVRWFYQD